MIRLDDNYAARLRELAKEIQQSGELAQFLDTEEEEDYKVLVEVYEPKLQELYETVAAENPLQLLSLEKAMLDGDFEGLFMPRILGFSILRGAVNERYNYRRPQDHLAMVMDSICESVNFDAIKSRIGQAIQVCFAISSDIWVTSFIEKSSSKSLKSYLKSKRLVKFRHLEERKRAYLNYVAQFRGMNFYTSYMPETKSELLLQYDKIAAFLYYRISNDLDHSSYESEMLKILEHTDWAQHHEYVHLLVLCLSFIDFSDKNNEKVKHVLTELRQGGREFSIAYFQALEEIFETGRVYFDFASDKRVHALVDDSIEDDLIKYYNATFEVATKGFVHEDTVEIVRQNYNAHEGLSKFNECLRYSILGHFQNVIKHLEPEDYLDYFELNKTLVLYINIFDNQLFSQSLKRALLSYIHKLLKKFTDKRAKDYQEIKKFVTNTFLDLKFMTEKELKELFKTKRKKKSPKAT